MSNIIRVKVTRLLNRTATFQSLAPRLGMNDFTFQLMIVTQTVTIELLAFSKGE